MSKPALETGTQVALGVTALSLIAYLPFLKLPLISDDYLQIGLARQYGSWEGQQALFADALYRCRATSLWLSWVLDQAFGPSALANGITCLLLHILNSMLVFALGYWSRIGWRVSGAAALFFAVYEGHQGAVVWYAALPELLVFTFALLTLLAWARWLDRGGALWLLIIVAAYLLCLLSKESGVVTVPLMAAFAWARNTTFKRWAPPVLFLGFLTMLYVWAIFDAKSQHLHFNDGTFSLSAPFYWTLLISTSRLFWFWGFVALVLGLASRTKEFRGLLGPSAFWILVTFLPYAFLTYMPRVPSRHTYFASAGLALLIGAAYIWAVPRLKIPGWAPTLLVTAVLLHNVLYLWIKKFPQYYERAQPTEQLLAYARTRPGTIHVSCFPYGEEVIYRALQISGGRTRDQIRVRIGQTEPNRPGFCYEGEL